MLTLLLGSLGGLGWWGLKKLTVGWEKPQSWGWFPDRYLKISRKMETKLPFILFSQSWIIPMGNSFPFFSRHQEKGQGCRRFYWGGLMLSQASRIIWGIFLKFVVRKFCFPCECSSPHYPQPATVWLHSTLACWEPWRIFYYPRP